MESEKVIKKVLDIWVIFLTSLRWAQLEFGCKNYDIFSETCVQVLCMHDPCGCIITVNLNLFFATGKNKVRIKKKKIKRQFELFF